ncbi:serine/threonine-protein phosphatase 2A, catalytic subunit [Trypanosoma theileri]|uniref:Serine/threonine-protein phosphatase n=1 Tax=Trypanosoma theileri TaxID=67003 RepID=A0A1X0P9R6_9TRYP|nr:serine/threonine-protein phosphatase 2A, catalytic subunit [Trypanosoma theileri]ORC93677.1 serine/threonine-protein phosphatase 2A, catalytic subunit [Trypanosoma theileri]
MGDVHRDEEALDGTIYFYSPLTTPPARNKYIKLISDLLQNTPITDVFLSGASDAILLCQDAREVLEKECVVLDIDITEKDDLIIVGDIHGQFVDLLHSVLSIQVKQSGKNEGSCKLPQPEYKFLFLGDYVDRGPRSVEVITLLLALKIEYPNHIFLLRGNHEEAQTCRMYGFFQECRAKLERGVNTSNNNNSNNNDSGESSGCGNTSSSAWLQYNMVFCWLPLAAVVRCPSGMFFCAHGGLSPQTKFIAGLKSLRRHEYGQSWDDAALFYAPSSPRSTDAGAMSLADERTVIDGLLWSDPEENVCGCHMNYRGCGFIFGPDVTREFLDCNYGYTFPQKDKGETNGTLQFIIRAHQCVQEGYQWAHNGLVLTLFSAPNYCGVNNNKGAIVILRGKTQVGKDRVCFDYKVYESASSYAREIGDESNIDDDDGTGAVAAAPAVDVLRLFNYFRDKE